MFDSGEAGSSSRGAKRAKRARADKDSKAHAESKAEEGGSEEGGEAEAEDAAGAGSAAGSDSEPSELDPGCPNVNSRDLNEADNAVRKHYRIKVLGYDPAPPLRSFRQLHTRLAAPVGLLNNLQVSRGSHQME